MLFTKAIALALPLVALAAPLKDADLVGVSYSVPSMIATHSEIYRFHTGTPLPNERR